MRVCLHDHSQIEAFLRRDPGLYLYLIGDLDPFFWPHTTWYGWLEEDVLQAMVMLYSGDELPVMLALGQTQQPLGALLASLKALLPVNFYSHLSPGLETCLQDSWNLSSGGRHYRMLLTRPERLPDFPCPEAEVLGASDEAALMELYAAAYPQNWFNARMLATGQYMGIRRDGKLLAVAGVHVYAPEQGVAALGNIAVHPQWRDQGWGTSLTAALCRQLAQSVEQIGLNVHAENAPALRCYEKLGFEVCAEYVEWMARGQIQAS